MEDIGYRKLSIVEATCSKSRQLMNIEDTSLLKEIEAVQEASKKILDVRKIVPKLR